MALSGARVDGAPAFEHVAFDLDGTLVDTAADLAAATNHVLATYGVAAVDPATLRSYVGDGARTLVSLALGPTRSAWVDEGVARFLAYYGEHLLDASRPYPGVVALLRRLRARGIHVSVVTNKAEALSREILDGLGLLPDVEVLIGGDSLPTRKPDPAGLACVLARTATPPDRALLVGDSPIDRETACRGGAAFCGVGWGFASHALRAERPTARIVEDVAALWAVMTDGAPGAEWLRLDSRVGTR